MKRVAQLLSMTWMAAVVMGAVVVAQPPLQIPAQIEVALSEVANLRVHLDCDLRWDVVGGDVAKLGARWSIGQNFFRVRSQSYSLDGERFHHSQYQHDSDPLPLPDGMHAEIAYDGAEIRYATATDAMGIHSPGSLGARIGKGSRPVPVTYFDATQIRVPASPGSCGDLPGSMILEALYQGAKLRRISGDGSEVWCVEQTLADGKRLSWLRADLNYAVVRSELWRGESLLMTTTNSSFFQVGSVHLPAQIVQDWRSWETVPEDVAAETVATTKMRVLRHRVPKKGDLAFRGRRAGTVVQDSRYGGFDAGRDGEILYHVPVPPDELRDKFDGAYEKASPGLSLSVWGLLHGFGLLVWFGLLTFAMRVRR